MIFELDLVSLQKWSCVVLLENLCSTFLSSVTAFICKVNAKMAIVTHGNPFNERCRKRHCRPMGHYLAFCCCTCNENSSRKIAPCLSDLPVFLIMSEQIYSDMMSFSGSQSWTSHLTAHKKPLIRHVPAAFICSAQRAARNPCARSA